MPDLRSPTITRQNLAPGERPANQAPQQVPSAETPVGKIVAKPLSSPDFLGVRAKNPAMSVRWVNRMYENGHRVDVHSAQGFEIAKPDEVVKLDGSPLPPSLAKNGQIIFGDLILMILPRSDYYGALLNNHNKAIRRTMKKGIQQRGEHMLAEELQDVPARNTDRKKIVVYAPASPHEIQESINEGRL